MKYCPKCGKELDDTAKFCNACGHQVDTSVAPQPPQQTPGDEKIKGMMIVGAVFLLLGGILVLVGVFTFVSDTSQLYGYNYRSPLTPHEWMVIFLMIFGLLFGIVGGAINNYCSSFNRKKKK